MTYHLLEIFGKGEELSEKEFINIILKYIEESQKEIVGDCQNQVRTRVEFLIKNKFIVSLIALFSLRLKQSKGVWQLVLNLCSISENEEIIELSNQISESFRKFKLHLDLDRNQQEYICFCSFICRAINQ